MNKKNHLVIALILLLNYGCSSDSDIEKETIKPLPPIIEQVKIFSFSQKYAYINDEISIIGENFNTDKSKIEIYLEGLKANVISISAVNIKIKIPAGITSPLPNLNVIIPNSTITYDSSFENIALLDNTKNKWIKINHDFNSINAIRNFKTINKEEIYFSLQETSSPGTINLFKVKESLNGGTSINVLNQDYNFTENNGSFLLSSKGNEYSFRANNLYRKNKGEQSKLLYDFSQNGSWGLDLFIDLNEENIIVTTAEGRIYKSNNSGNTFEKMHENSPSNYQFDSFFALSSNQIWLAGFNNPEAPLYNPAKILYLKEDGKWYNKSVQLEIKDGNSESIKKIHFINQATGYGIAKIYNNLTKEEKHVIIKSETKGDTWNIVHEKNQKIEAFTFKNEDIGWYISGKEIFKTIDGGVSWNLEYTNDTDCKGILYTDSVLWVIANQKLLKYYF